MNAQVDITINVKSIDRVRVAKFLGVLIDEKLNWKDHTATVKPKFSQSTTILYKFCQYKYTIQYTQRLRISCTAQCSYNLLGIVLKYGEIDILLMSIVLSYSKKEGAMRLLTFT